MTSATILNALVPILVGVFWLVALVFFIRGIMARQSVAEGTYGVARQEARHDMVVAFSRGLIMLVLGLILFGIYGISPRLRPVETAPTPVLVSPPTLSPTATVEVVIAVTETAPVSAPPTPTSPLVAPTEAPTSTPEPTATEIVPVAVVDSPNGLWLREQPGGTQELELIPDGTSLEVLPGREVADELDWQQVRTPIGNEGWVAVEFLDYQ
jgi:hypothetical protein